MDCRNYIDISSYMLFEATGDSEDDSDVNLSIGAKATDLAEDDAFSCSCDNEYNDLFDHRTKDYIFVNEEDEEEEKSVDVNDEEEDVVDQVQSDHNYDMVGVKGRRGQEEDGGVFQEGPLKKLKVCRSDFVKDRDKDDQHFWETCLAS